MELVKNIFFNTDRLTPNTNIKISYTGKFFQDNSKKVYLHYGFGNVWEKLTDQEMIRNELGFQLELDLIDSTTFNFCFKNEKDEWDNNNGANYIFDLEELSLDLIVSDDITDLDKPHKLRKAYLWSKKIRLAVYKIITYIPKIISGNYKRRIKE